MGEGSFKPEVRVLTTCLPNRIKEIAAFLKEEAGFVVHIVGHIDFTGGFDHNMDLSRRRAEAVVKALVSDHNIKRERLHSHGVGSLVPTATNETKEGRTQNRRVELVVKLQE